MALNEAAQRALTEVEAALKANGAQLQKEAPQQFARIKDVVQAVKAGKTGSDQIRQHVLELLQWQIELQKRELNKQIAQLAPLLPNSEAARKADTALKRVLELLEKAAQASKARTPNVAAQQSVAQASAKAQVAVSEAEGAIRRSAQARVAKPPRADSKPASGLKSLTNFKVRPGVGAGGGSVKPPSKKR